MEKLSWVSVPSRKPPRVRLRRATHRFGLRGHIPAPPDRFDPHCHGLLDRGSHAGRG